MKISVIIPVWNEAARIRDSVTRAWSAGADEVLVADGGSTDQTAEIVATLNCRCLVSDRGRATQQNAASQQATGEVLLFLHADNWLPPGTLDQIRQAMGSPSCTHGAFHQQIEAAGAGYRALEWGNSRRVLWLGLPYGDQGLFIRRELFEQVGRFPQVRLMEDLLLSKKLRQYGWPQLLPGPLHVDARRWRRHGIVRQTIRNWTLLSAYHLGVPLDRLALFYATHEVPNSTHRRDPAETLDSVRE